MFIAFIGQLPYTATSATIKEYFVTKASVLPQEIHSVRLLTNKETKVSRGMFDINLFWYLLWLEKLC